MNFIDTNILVLASYDNAQQIKCQDVIRGGGVINSLILAETFTVLERIVDRDLAQSAITSFLRSNLEIVDVDTSIVFTALKESKKTHVHFFDLVHYVTALAKECSAICSYDKDFDSFPLPRREP